MKSDKMYGEKGLPFINYGSDHSVNLTDEDRKFEKRFLIGMLIFGVLVIIGHLFGIIN